MSDQDMNEQLVLIGGYSAAGKSASLREIKDQPDWMYLNTEAGKRLPFKNKFNTFSIDDPYQVHEAFDHAIATPEIKGIIVDSATFLMDMYETQYVLPASNTMKAWGDFAQYFKILMQEKVVKFARPTVFTAHVLDVLDEKNMEMKTSVPIKGSLKNNGIEALEISALVAKAAQDNFSNCWEPLKPLYSSC